MTDPDLPEGWSWEDGPLGRAATRPSRSVVTFRCYVFDGQVCFDLAGPQPGTAIAPLDVVYAVLLLHEQEELEDNLNDGPWTEPSGTGGRS